MSTKTKTINGLNFEISQPYFEGHVVTEAEARVLNQTRSENIGNNVRAKLKEQIEAGATPEELASIVAERDAEYVFTLANVGESQKLDPYEKEANNMARSMLKNHLSKNGRKLTVTPEGSTDDEWKEKIGAEVDRIAQSAEVIKASKSIVDARRKQADNLLTAMEGTTL